MFILAILLFLAKLIIGIGLIFGCIRGLITQEWVYDQQSSQMMNASQLLGVVVGVALVADALGFIHIPLI